MPQRATPPQRTRIDWGIAKARYVELGPDERSYARIHREFGVSEVTVQKHAKREGWVDAAREADEAAAAEALKIVGRSRAERAAQTLRLYDAAGDKLESHFEEATELDPDFLRRLRRDLDRAYRLEIGDVTDRFEISEVRELTDGLTSIARRFVDDTSGTVQERRDLFLTLLQNVRAIKAPS